ncbi:MAG: hypothetical protein QE271_05480 [Bacteriovoracaceae bacterium]|nr:hypothetical protein [Bacteriovoracaceae bacterium]
MTTQRLARLFFYLTSILLNLNSGFSQNQDSVKTINWNRFIPHDSVPFTSVFKGELTKNDKRTLVLLTELEKQKIGIDKDVLAFANFAKLNPSTQKINFYVIQFPSIKIDTNPSLKNISKIVGLRSSKDPAELTQIESLVYRENGVIQNIKEVTFVKEHWSARARPETYAIEVHCLIKFVFEQGSTFDKYLPNLVINQTSIENNQWESSVLPTKERVQTNVIISGEAIRAQSHPQAGFFPSAMKLDFAFAHLIYDYEARKSTTISEGGEYEELPMRFENIVPSFKYSKTTKSPKLSLLFEGFHRNLALGRVETYNLFIKNCTNSLFEIMDDVLKFKADYRFLNDDIVNFIREDAPSLIATLSAKKIENSSLPPEVAIFLYQSNGEMSEALLVNYLKTLESKAAQTTLTKSDIKFLAAWPPFVEGQLKARNLLK